MDITINLNDESSLSDAIQKLKKFETDFESAVQTFIRRVGALGVTVVRGAYDHALYAGTNDITVELVNTTNGCEIRASGESLGFIEFGTGIYTPLGVSAGEVGAPPHGTYGRRQGANPKGWLYPEGNGVGNLGVPSYKYPGWIHTYGNPPADAFELARDQIKASVTQIAQEVFG